MFHFGFKVAGEFIIRFGPGGRGVHWPGHPAAGEGDLIFLYLLMLINFNVLVNVCIALPFNELVNIAVTLS